MTEVAAREEAKVKRGRGGGGGRGGRGGGGWGRGGRGTMITDCGHVMQRSEPEKREDGLYGPLGLPMKHLAVDGLCYAPFARFVISSGITSRADDVLVATYPRSGTTWTLEIVRNIHLVQNPGFPEDHPLRTIDHKVSAQWINAGIEDPSEEVEQKASPRVMKTHNYYQHLLVPAANKTAKIIHTIRDPKDVVCSLFHHCIRAERIFGWNGPFEEFVTHFMNGHVESGSYWDFNQGFLENKHHLNILYLKYEDLKNNPEGSFERINEFLGYPALSPEQMLMVKEKTSFDTMKDTQKPVSGEKVQGKVGSHQTMLSEKQVTCIDDKTRETLANFASVSDYSLAAI